MAAEVRPLSDPAWLHLVSCDQHATIFHHPAWAGLLSSCYGFRQGGVIVAPDQVGLAAGIPVLQVGSPLLGRRAIALPFTDFCAPVGDPGEGVLHEFVRVLQEWRKDHKLAQLQVRWPLPLQEGVYPDERFYQHLTPLHENADTVFSTFKKTQVQRHIGQAERLGLTTHRGTDWEDVRRFYGLHVQTRKRLGVPVQPKRFFHLLWARLLEQGMGFVLLAYKGDQVVAGALFLHFNTTLTYKFGASLPEYWKLRPNDLLFWRAIQWGCKNKYQVFDWGRTDIDDEGLRHFKSGWGSQETILHYSLLADKPPEPDAFGRWRNVLRDLIQRSPSWVCRGLGELFYRYAA